MSNTIVVAALYHFVSLPDYKELQQPLLDVCLENDIRGTLLLAEEGINGTVAGTREGIDALLAYLRNDPRLTDLDHKESFTGKRPFYRMKVKLKKEIVTIGIPEVSPTQCVGEYIEPKDWNAIISDPETIVIDTRNDYEYELGTFKGAIDPKTKSFREFPKYIEDNVDVQQHKKVAMFCTGGIRCEKASSFMLTQGFEKVYHLKGGILKYLEEVPQEESLWEGECFVFDDRVAVDHNLKPGEHRMCFGCKNPISPEDMASRDYEEGIQCPKCASQLTQEKRQRLSQRQHQIHLAKKRGHAHIGCPVT
tara:strand:- start:27576 stop:28496 length:921 start_codon:yes stop_codon:yes gene_type:complete